MLVICLSTKSVNSELKLSHSWNKGMYKATNQKPEKDNFFISARDCQVRPNHCKTDRIYSNA